MAIVIPTTVVEKILKCVSYPVRIPSSDGKLSLMIHCDRFTIHTNELSPKHFAELKFDDLTEHYLGQILAKCYIYDSEVHPDYRANIFVTEPDPDEEGKSLPVYEFFIGREGSQVWIGLPLESYGSALFNLPKIE